jgi:hypothetical protein
MTEKEVFTFQPLSDEELINKETIFLELCDNIIEPTYKIPYITGSTDLFIAQACLGARYTVSGVEFKKLSSKNRVKLDFCYNAYGKFIPVLYPGDVIESATLFIVVDNYKTSEIKYVPLKTVKNITQPFTFFDYPIRCAGYHRLSLELKYSKSRIDTRTKYIGVECLIHSPEVCKKIADVYMSVFENKKKEKAKEKPNIKNCPVCSEPSIIICNFTYRDSTCSNGHKWHYNPSENKVCEGHKHEMSDSYVMRMNGAFKEIVDYAK